MVGAVGRLWCSPARHPNAALQPLPQFGSVLHQNSVDNAVACANSNLLPRRFSNSAGQVRPQVQGIDRRKLCLFSSLVCDVFHASNACSSSTIQMRYQYPCRKQYTAPSATEQPWWCRSPSSSVIACPFCNTTQPGSPQKEGWTFTQWNFNKHAPSSCTIHT